MEKEVIASIITGSFGFLAGLASLAHSIRTSRKQHEISIEQNRLSASIAESEKRLNALKLAREEAVQIQEPIRLLLFHTQRIKQCIDIFIVDAHPAKNESIQQVRESSTELGELYSHSLGVIPEDVRRWCHGLKNVGYEVYELVREYFDEFGIERNLTKEEKEKFLKHRFNLNDYQRSIEKAIRGLDYMIANRLLAYLSPESEDS